MYKINFIEGYIMMIKYLSS